MDAPRNGAATERRADEVVAGGTRAWCAGAGGCKGDGALTRAGVANGTGLAEAECDV